MQESVEMVEMVEKAYGMVDKFDLISPPGVNK